MTDRRARRIIAVEHFEGSSSCSGRQVMRVQSRAQPKPATPGRRTMVPVFSQELAGPRGAAAKLRIENHRLLERIRDLQRIGRLRR